MSQPCGGRAGRGIRAALLMLALTGAPLLAGAAHDIPAGATVLALVRPEGRRLVLVIRVPLEAMRDVQFPLRPLDYLDLSRTAPLLPDAARQWIASSVQLFEGDTPLPTGRVVATQLSLPSDRSFERYPDAAAHVTGPPLPEATQLPWRQAMLDVLLEYPIESDRSRFSITPALAHLALKTTTVLRFLPATGGERAYRYDGDPGLVRLDPRWHQAALSFVKLGFRHILDGIDHLLFLLCLVIPFRRFRPLIVIVTSFTVAHSLTLMASALGFAPSGLWFPPLVEVLIAASILWMALENIVGPRLGRRWLIAFGFGLIHGFGFSFALKQSLQFAGSHLVTSLLSFNLGVELGQLAVLIVAVPVLELLFRRVVAERMGTIILSALIAHTAWHWAGDRVRTLRQYSFEWPQLDSSFAAAALRGLMLLLAVVGIGWLLAGWLRPLAGVEPKGQVASDTEGELAG